MHNLSLGNVYFCQICNSKKLNTNAPASNPEPSAPPANSSETSEKGI